MKIIAATALQVHGYLDIAVEFNNDLTFIVGPNGSGKTTILYLMQLALSLSLDKLSRIRFSEFIMHFLDDKDIKRTIYFTNVENTITLFVPDIIKNGIPFRYLLEDPYMYSYMKRDLLKNQKYSKVVEFFNEIKKPCFLNVERVESVREDDEDDRYYDIMVRRKEIDVSNKKRLKNVSDLIASAFKDIAERRDVVSKELYTEIFMSLFTHNHQHQESNLLNKPDRKKVNEIKLSVNELILKTFTAKNKAKYDVIVNRFFDNPPTKPSTSDLPGSEKDFMELLGYNFQLNRILALQETYNRYNTRLDSINEPIRKFINVINEYYKDCGLSVDIDTLGKVVIVRPDGSISGINELSSGETQLLIIFAYLIFGANKDSRIFIIDEPELSLHLKWQGMLSQTIMSLNPTSQVILATHSPDIIGRYNHKAWNLKYHGKVN